MSSFIPCAGSFLSLDDDRQQELIDHWRTFTHLDDVQEPNDFVRNVKRFIARGLVSEAEGLIIEFNKHPHNVQRLLDMEKRVYLFSGEFDSLHNASSMQRVIDKMPESEKHALVMSFDERSAEDWIANWIATQGHRNHPSYKRLIELRMKLRRLDGYTHNDNLHHLIDSHPDL